MTDAVRRGPHSVKRDQGDQRDREEERPEIRAPDVHPDDPHDRSIPFPGFPIHAPMNRRDALKLSTTAIAATWLASSGLVAACAKTEPRKAAPSSVVSADDQTLFEALADTLLPTTPNSPGAKAAGAGAAIALLLNDCYERPDQQRAISGLADLRDRCRQRTGADFTTLPRDKREQFLRELDADAKKAGDKHYFHLVRELANTAYFSSEVGMTKALRYIPIPGKWVGCMPLEPNQPAWG